MVILCWSAASTDGIAKEGEDAAGYNIAGGVGGLAVCW